MHQEGITLPKPTQRMLREYLEMRDEARGAIITGTPDISIET